MKPPKEPKTFKYPRMYLLEHRYGERLRILYPNGDTEVSGSTLMKGTSTFESARKERAFHYGKGCWNYGNFKNGFDALEGVRLFDRVYNRYNRITFLGEVK